MKLRSPFLIKSTALLGATLVKRLVGTLDIRIDSGSCGRHPTNPRDSRFIYVFWHDSMLIPTIFKSRTHILISQHADGELIANLVGHLGFRAVRGSSSKGSTAAIFNLLAVSKRSHLCVTPDGPRGPRRRIQPGSVFLASHTGLPIIPVGVAMTNAWHAKSWDRFAIPKPFSSARVVFGETMVVPPKVEMRRIPEYVNQLQQQMDWACAEADRWAAGEPRRTPSQVTLPFAKSA